MKIVYAFVLLFVGVGVPGCATRNTAVIPMWQGVGQADQCKWVMAADRYEKSFLGISVVTELPYDEALFYCCPGADGTEPKCRKAQWTR